MERCYLNAPSFRKILFSFSAFFFISVGANASKLKNKRSIRALAIKELTTSAPKTESKRWMTHAATISPITLEKSKPISETIYQLTFAAEPFSSAGSSAMSELNDFQLKHYPQSILASARLAWIFRTPFFTKFRRGHYTELAIGQQDGDLPLNSSSQSGAIRLHHIFLELGLLTSWKPHSTSNISINLGIGAGQHTLIQSSALNQARYSTDSWHYSWSTELLYHGIDRWSFGLGYKSRSHLSSSNDSTNTFNGGLSTQVQWTL